MTLSSLPQSLCLNPVLSSAERNRGVNGSLGQIYLGKICFLPNWRRGVRVRLARPLSSTNFSFIFYFSLHACHILFETKLRDAKTPKETRSPHFKNSLHFLYSTPAPSVLSYLPPAPLASPHLQHSEIGWSNFQPPTLGCCVQQADSVVFSLLDTACQ